MWKMMGQVQHQQFGFEGGDLIPDEAVSAAANSISDVLRSGGEATEVAWGLGAQDVVANADPVALDPSSSAEILRGGPGGEPYVSPASQVSASERVREGAGSLGALAYTPADPEISTGSVDWTRVISAVPATVGAVTGAVVAVGNAVARLAGVSPGQAVRGNPAPGGSTQPTLLQRLFGQSGPTAPAAGAGTLTSQVGTLATVGLVAGVGLLLVRGFARGR